MSCLTAYGANWLIASGKYINVWLLNDFNQLLSQLGRETMTKRRRVGKKYVD
jgi:hypothetical protein